MKMTETEMRWQVMLAVISTDKDQQYQGPRDQDSDVPRAAHFATWACTVAEMTVLEFNEREQRIKECEERLGPKEVFHSWVRDE